MSKSSKKAADQAEREKVHKRYSNRREPDVVYPARKQVDFYDADIHQRVAVYVRVSTDRIVISADTDTAAGAANRFLYQVNDLVKLLQAELRETFRV